MEFIPSSPVLSPFCKVTVSQGLLTSQPQDTHRTVELQFPGQQGGDELEDGVPHAVEGGGGQLVVVVHVVAVTFGLQLEGLSEHLAQYGREELVVGDVLDLGPHHLPGLLVERLLVPVGVDGLQEGGQTVVFPHQDGVQGGQAGVVVDPLVPGAETLAGAGPGLQPAVGVVLVLGQQVTSVNLHTQRQCWGLVWAGQPNTEISR